MTFIGNPRLRAILIGGVTLTVVAALGIGAASAANSSSGRWVTATAATGDVAQVYNTTGSITRKNTIEASYAVDGTVRSVAVQVGDTVAAGQVLAKLDTRALKLAVLQAETSVAQAKLSLYNAQNPTSSASTPGGNSGASSGGASVDLNALNKAAAAVSAALKTETTVCDPIMTWINADVSSASATTTEATTSGSPSPVPSAASTDEPSTDEPSVEDLAACGKARAQVTAANQQLQAVVKQANKSAASGSKSTTTTTTVSASQVAQAKAAVLSAEQTLSTATDDLDAAELLAPVSGTVGTVGLTKGDSASAGSITIVGSGDAVVSLEVPLTTRTALRVGGKATVTAAGSQTALSGTITFISPLETSGTSGTPTFTTTIVVPDAKKVLASGSKASVSIPMTSVTGVVTVPASAVTPTGTGTATVSVLAAGSQTPTVTQVSTGAVGSGVVQITKGLSVGATVVLADRDAAVPSNSTSNNRSKRSSSSTQSTSGTAQGGSQTNR